ncbi:Mpp10 protein [Viridothelium virens]|uniref:U3 small nucleolar ribonucleoprotein protein MPP10 n=1 Tax=Viridothelium virens TaxID=1048519 RepID=A0A6A6GZI4_VIRVR|nr:Mpp10 protein [Viridothelium virens]
MILQNNHGPSNLLEVLAQSPHDFLQPTNDLHNAALVLTKRYLDPVASNVSAKQQFEYQESRRKRKRGEEGNVSRPLQLKQIHVEGFGIDQVFEQAKKILSATRHELARAIPELEATTQSLENGNLDTGAERKEQKSTTDESSLGEEGVDWEYDGDDISVGEELEDGNEVQRLHRDTPDNERSSEGLDDLERIDHDDLSDGSEVANGDSSTFVADLNGLNDGFFSIDDFNRNSEFLEQQDVRGDPNDGAASDEEDIDWSTNPLFGNADIAKVHGNTRDNEDENSDDDDEGPTFGDSAGSSDQDEDEEMAFLEEDSQDVGAMGNTNDILYADFFAPPARKASKKKRGRPNPHNFPEKDTQKDQQRLDGQEDEVERTMSSVHHDLFDDALSENESEDLLSDADPGDPKSRRSNHERRQAKIAEEIRRLEAANVAKREWTLSGEARAADRPINSLLEEDLDFERAGKPVPVITQEVSEDIEALIKRRILAQDFDEVIRRRPDDLVTGPDARRGRQRVELDDTKPVQGLAEEYEQEHLRRTDPDYVDARDEKLKKEHQEIESLWKDVSARLDALTNWHYKPKPAAPNLEVRVDMPTVMMEDAQPAVGGDVGGASMLAPQEVYAAGEAHVGDDVVATKGGMPVSREEMSREEKTRRRRRKKERTRKAGAQEEVKESEKTREKKAVLGDLKRGGVKVIGKKGDIVDVEGNRVKGQQTKTGGAYKL